MATTTVWMQSTPGVSTTRLFMTSFTGTGTPNAAGYLQSFEFGGWYRFNNVIEALVGTFLVHTQNSSSQVLANGFCVIQDDTGSYFVFDPPSPNFQNWVLASVISDVQTGLTNQGYTSARSNNLDATISSREAESAAATRGTTNVTEHDATQATLAALNNLSIANVQTAMTNQGYTSGRGPNLDNLNATVSSRSTLTAANVWDYLTSTATTAGSLGKLLVDNLNATISSRSTLTAAAVWDYLSSAATTVGSLGKRIVDNLDAAITSREAESSAATRATTNQTEHDATQTALASVNVTIDATDKADIAAGVWDALESTVVTSSSMGLKLKNNLNATITSRLAESDNVTRQAILVAEHDATQAQITALNNLSIANVQTAMTSQGYTTGRAPNLDNLDATVSTRALATTMTTRFNTLDTGQTNIRSDIAAINVASGCSSALVSAGYTSARSTKLDNLDNLTVAAPTAAAITNAVLDKALSSHTTVGTVGAGLTLARDQATIAANQTQD